MLARREPKDQPQAQDVQEKGRSGSFASKLILKIYMNII